jgi:hypothetical protein
MFDSGSHFCWRKTNPPPQSDFLEAFSKVIGEGQMGC